MVSLLNQMSLVLRKPAFYICENKDADQLCGYLEADQRLCFCYTDSTIPPLSKSEISSFQPSYVAVQPGLYLTRSKTPKTCFLRTRLKLFWVEALRPRQQFFSYVGTFSWVEPVVSNEDEVNCFVVAMSDLVHDVETMHGLG